MSQYATKCSDTLLEMLKKGVPLTDASKMHMSNAVIRTLPTEAMPRSKMHEVLLGVDSLNPKPNPGLVLPGMLLPLCAPATGSCTCYIQSKIPTICQTWMWGESGWMPVQEGHSHPHLMGYYLSIAGSREPSWVTRKTMAMYHVKNRKCHP
ncbi:hypothetical protein EDD16DRAFT_1528250 [Pisolithus croceorrhizus]|nr:hypothetical protein EDD16DRAFT_1528250 [Pisolithus croceorrhizus]KAI6115440.1 hypothetical protein EV401DRAFT_1889593 [Pisolithus croceorrhizus]KAI6167579.1 hypothetical protein EDD17DRAFT_1503858 [Pisolithus thermaeus]